MKILITGGAGFIGTNLCKRLLKEGHKIDVLDNLSSSKKFPDGVGIIKQDIKDLYKWFVLKNRYDQIYHLACQASPPRYQKDPIDTLLTNVVGTQKILDYAQTCKARILFTSTSEIYGDPTVHPQHEKYTGDVNCVGPRACYDEGKRAAETLCYDYYRTHGLDIRVARIFNTFGPHMDLEDGRVVTNFISQMLKDEQVTIYGNGTQTRSFCYVDDIVEGLISLMNFPDSLQPINLGNPDEISIKTLANEMAAILNYKPKFIYLPLPQDDPKIRRPDITRAKHLLQWEPKISRLEGLEKTIQYFKESLNV